MREPILEPVLRKMRIARVLPLLLNIPECRLLDIGCGWKAQLLHDVEPYIASGVGIDFKAPVLEKFGGKLSTISTRLIDFLPFADKTWIPADS